METETDKIYDFAKFVLNRNDEAIRFSDTKAAIMLTASSLVVTILVDKSVEISQTFCSFDLNQKPLLITSLILLVLGLLIVTISALVGIFPRLTKSKSPGLIYFGDIHAQTSLDITNKLSSMSSVDLIDQIFQQIQITSEIVYKKFMCIRIANIGIISILIGFIGGVLAIFIS